MVDKKELTEAENAANDVQAPDAPADSPMDAQNTEVRRLQCKILIIEQYNYVFWWKQENCYIRSCVIIV